mgnify:FL=1
MEEKYKQLEMEEANFNVGDTVWVVKNSKAVQKKVTLVYIHPNGPVYYVFDWCFYKSDITIGDELPSKEVFATKDELIKSL